MEFEGQNLDEALRAASAALGIEADELSYEMLDEGRRGVLGLGARRVRVRVTVPETLPAPLAASEPSPLARHPGDEALAHAAKEAPADIALPADLARTVERLFTLMGFSISTRCSSHEGGCTVHLEGPDRKPLLKNEGEVLEAVEFVLNRMSRRLWPEVGSIRVECEGFRDRRDLELVELAREVAGVVARTGRSEMLHEMNPYERRLVHIAVREFPGVVSRSEGEGFLKRIRVEKARG